MKVSWQFLKPGIEKEPPGLLLKEKTKIDIIKHILYTEGKDI